MNRYNARHHNMGKEAFEKLAGMLDDVREVQFFLVLFTKVDAQIALQLGAAVCFDKPILILNETGQPLPAKLLRVADEVIDCPGGIESVGKSVIRDALDRMVLRTTPLEAD